LNKLTTPVRRFCQAILRQYPLMKKELAALEEEKQAIAEKVPVATWQEPVRVSAIGDRTANQAFKRSSPIFCVKIPLVRTKCFYHHRLAYYTASDPLGVKDTLSLGFAALDTRGLRRIRILTGGDRLSYLNYFFL